MRGLRQPVSETDRGGQREKENDRVEAVPGPVRAAREARADHQVDGAERERHEEYGGRRNEPASGRKVAAEQIRAETDEPGKGREIADRAVQRTGRHRGLKE